VPRGSSAPSDASNSSRYRPKPHRRQALGTAIIDPATGRCLIESGVDRSTVRFQCPTTLDRVFRRSWGRCNRLSPPMLLHANVPTRELGERLVHVSKSGDRRGWGKHLRTNSIIDALVLSSNPSEQCARCVGNDRNRTLRDISTYFHGLPDRHDSSSKPRRHQQWLGRENRGQRRSEFAAVFLGLLRLGRRMQAH
jgi:hypothetical protein